jgi:hypothetical protein
VWTSKFLFPSYFLCSALESGEKSPNRGARESASCIASRQTDKQACERASLLPRRELKEKRLAGVWLKQAERASVRSLFGKSK